MFEFFNNKTQVAGKGQLTPAFVDEVSSLLEKAVSDLNLPSNRKVQLRLATETVLVNWLEFYPSEQMVSFKLQRLWGKYYVELRLTAEEHNPLLDSTLYGLPLEYDRIITAVKSADDVYPSYRYSKGQNIVKISLPRKQLSSTLKTFIAILAAVGTYELCSLFPPETGQYIAKEVFNPCAGMILGIIKMLSSVMIFTAMVTSICSMGTIQVFTRYGRAMLLHIQMCNLLAVVLGLVVAVFCFNITVEGMAIEAKTLTPLIKILMGIVPSDLVTPFKDNNSTQILFIGAAVGCFFLTVQDEVKSLFHGIKELHFTVMNLLMIICKFIPYVVYFSVAQLLMNSALGSIEHILKIILVYSGAMLSYVLLRLVYIYWRTRVSVLSLLRGFSHAVITGLTSASSMIMMPLIQIRCQKDFKIHDSLLNFALPLEIIMLKPLSGMFMIVMALAICQYYGIEISLTLLVSSVIFVTLISSAIPPVPGGGIVVLTLVFNHFGLPQEALALPIAVEVLFDMLRTGFHGYIWGAELVLMDNKLCKSTK